MRYNLSVINRNFKCCAHNLYFRGIYHYSTTSTDEAVFIIGGHDTGNIVAEYKDDTWRHAATLKQGRSRHSSIVLGSQTIIIGGTHTFDAK